MVLRSIVAMALFAASAFPQAPPPIPRPDLGAVSEIPRQRAEALRVHYDELARTSAPVGERAEAAGSLGQIYFALSLFEAANAAFSSAAFLASGDYRWSYYQALVSRTLGRPEEAMDAFLRAHELRPEDLATLIRLGDLYLLLDRTDDAEEAFGEVLRIDSDSAAGRYGLGRVAAKRKDYAGAVRDFESVLEIQPESSGVHYPLGQAYRRLGDRERAREHLALRGDGGVTFPDPLADIVASRVLGSAFESLQDLAAAEGFSEVDFLGFALSQLGSAGVGATRELRAALASWARGAAELDPSSAEAAAERIVRGRMHYALGGLLVDQGLEEEGIAEFRTALDLAPELEDARIKLGNAEVRAGGVEQGIAEYTLVLELNLDNTAALLKRGAALMSLGRDREAIPDLERVRSLDPADTQAHLRLALAHQHVGEIDEARRLYESALDRDLDLNEVAGAHLELGHLDRDFGALDSALEHYRAAVVANPEFDVGRFEHATLLGRLRRFDESAAAYRALIERRPDHEQARFGEVTALMLIGREREARTRLEEGVAALPSSLQLTQTLARLLAAAGDRSVRDGERAVELATQAVTARSSLENAETMAMAMAEAGRFENAVALQSRLVEEAAQRGEEPLLQRLRAHLALYRRGQSCCGD